MAADGPGNPFGNTGAYHITYHRTPQVIWLGKEFRRSHGTVCGQKQYVVGCNAYMAAAGERLLHLRFSQEQGRNGGGKSSSRRGVRKRLYLHRGVGSGGVVASRSTAWYSCWCFSLVARASWLSASVARSYYQHVLSAAAPTPQRRRLGVPPLRDKYLTWVV